MASGTASAAQVVQATGNLDDDIGQSISGVAELVFGNATNLYPGDGMLHAYPGSRQAAIVPFLTRLQFGVLGLFFGWSCACTAGAYP